MKDSVAELIKMIRLNRLDDNRFEGYSLDIGSQSVYGGQVLAQALYAAAQTVDPERGVHSLHSYFLRKGDKNEPIFFEVENLRDGRSFSSRRVTAYQNDKAIFILAASFQISEQGLEHQLDQKNIIPPDSLQRFSDFFQKFAEKYDFKPKGLFSRDSPIEFRMVENIDPMNPGKRPPFRHAWFRVVDALPDDVNLHKYLLAYASDFNLLISALLPHNVSFFLTPMQIASLDHSMWFHRSFRIDEWLLFAVDSPSASNGRGFARGNIFDTKGGLVASVTQEGLIRVK